MGYNYPLVHLAEKAMTNHFDLCLRFIRKRSAFNGEMAFIGTTIELPPPPVLATLVLVPITSRDLIFLNLKVIFHFRFSTDYTSKCPLIRRVPIFFCINKGSILFLIIIK